MSEQTGGSVSVQLEVKDRPIIFSGAMVRAILEGRKGQTRRVVKPHRSWYVHSVCKPEAAADPWAVWFHYPETERVGHLVECPYGKPGDRLWVRETWWNAAYYPSTMPSGEASTDNWSDKIHYAADGDPENTPNRHYPTGLRNGAISSPDPYAIWLKRPSIFLPRRHSRLTLEITKVRVERVQEISGQDCIAEGIDISANSSEGEWTARKKYQELWDKINAKREGGIYAWDKNPWVWVVEFERVQA